MYNISAFLKYLAQSNTVNFILMVAILVWCGYKLHLGECLNRAVENVASSIKKSDEEKSKSKENFEKMQQEISHLPQELDEIKNNSAEREAALKTQIEASTQKSISNIEQNVPKILKMEEKKISDGIIDDAVQKSVSSAKDNIINLLKSNPELHEKFIEESLSELDKVKL